MNRMRKWVSGVGRRVSVAACPAVNLFYCGVAAALALAAAGSARANNLTITNVTVSGRDNSTAYVQFDIKWENSWRYSNTTDALYFHDAAWVFFKVQPDGQADWQHVTLEGTGTNPTDYVVGTGTPIEMVVPSDRVGMFVRRSGDGAGTILVTNVKAVWNFASNGLVKTDKVKIQAFGLEMVYVAQGTNTVGDGTSANITGQFEAGTGGTPFAITNESYEITLGGGADAWRLGNNNASGMYGEGLDDFSDSTSKTLPAAFPKGYAAFYCMKYEITQGQWVDFFNTLTDSQKTTRDITSNVNGGKNSDGTVVRNTVAWTTDNATASTPDRACNYLSWADGAAFADWAGLRPMTELEFEKACRGPIPAVADEYPCGDITTPTAITSETGDGTGTSTANPAGASCCYNGQLQGPCRVGIFATNGTTRAAAGASYWGIMELGGNVWERVVSVGNTNGRNFTGLHGDGKLTTSGTQGDANVIAWPAPSTASGAAVRGGGWPHVLLVRVSDRYYSAYGYPMRDDRVGSRAVRTAGQ